MRVNLPLLTVGELCPADNPLKMINDYPFEMSNFEMTLSLKWYMTFSSKGAKAPSILSKCSMTISSKWYFESKLSFARLRRVPSSCRLNPDQIQSARTRLKKIVRKSFWDDLWLSFRNERRSSVFVSIWYMTVISKWRRKNFRTENYFRQRKYLKFSWRKCPLNPIFSYTDFFAATVP